MHLNLDVLPVNIYIIPKYKWLFCPQTIHIQTHIQYNANDKTYIQRDKNVKRNSTRVFLGTLKLLFDNDYCVGETEAPIKVM